MSLTFYRVPLSVHRVIVSYDHTRRYKLRKHQQNLGKVVLGNPEANFADKKVRSIGDFEAISSRGRNSQYHEKPVGLRSGRDIRVWNSFIVSMFSMGHGFTNCVVMDKAANEFMSVQARVVKRALKDVGPRVDSLVYSFMELG